VRRPQVRSEERHPVRKGSESRLVIPGHFFGSLRHYPRRSAERERGNEQAADPRDGLSVSPFSTGVPNRQRENCAAVVGSRPPDGNRHPNPAPLRRAAALPSYPAWWGRLPSGSGAMLAKRLPRDLRRKAGTAPAATGTRISGVREPSLLRFF
jgi:hypothetical protein